MLKAKDLRDQSVEELLAACEDARKELFRMVNEAKHARKVDNPQQIRNKRKDIAKLLTVIHEKQQAKQKSAA